MYWQWVLFVLLIFIIKCKCHEFFMKKNPVFVFIYVDWCGHCKRLKPVMNEVISYYENNPNIDVIKINGEEDKTLINKLNVNSYPTLMFFPTGIIRKELSITYNGPRTTKAIKDFLKHS